MVKMIFLQIALYLVTCNVLRLHASDHSSEQCKRKEESHLNQATECNSNDFKNIPENKEPLDNLRSELAGFPESQKKLDEKMASVKEQKEKGKDSSENKSEVEKVITTLISSLKKIKSQEYPKIVDGVLDIVSSLANMADPNVPYVKETRILLTILSSLFLTETKPSVLEQLANVVHDEMIDFKRSLHEQTNHGLKRRASEQISQLRQMKEGEKLDDPNLWNDYVQFLGELAFRFESPLPYRYEDNLTKDADVKDFVTAVVTYSEAHSLFMALLHVAKGKYHDLGLELAHKDDIAVVERKMSFQSEDAKEKLAFLSKEKLLTYPEGIEGGKLTKIVALSRSDDKRKVEAVRHSLGLTPMSNLSTIESSANQVNQQFMHLRPVERCDWSLWDYLSYSFATEFINDVDYPMKINVSGEIGWSWGSQVKSVPNIQPYSWHHQNMYPLFSTAGNITLYFNNTQRVIEFAVSFAFFSSKIGLKETTEAELSCGLAAYNTRSEGAVTLKFSEDGKNYTAKAEIVVRWPDRIWRFAFREAPGDEEH